MTVKVTRRDYDADALRDHASRVSEADVVRRLLALALVLEARNRAHSAKTCGMDRQSLRDWVHRYNEQGIDGLSNLPQRGGASPKLSVAEKTISRPGSNKVRILRKMASYAGGYAICVTGSWHASSW